MASPRSCQLARVDDAACPWTAGSSYRGTSPTEGRDPSSWCTGERPSAKTVFPLLSSPGARSGGLCVVPRRWQTLLFTIVRRDLLTTIRGVDLQRWTPSDVRGPPPAALAVWPPECVGRRLLKGQQGRHGKAFSSLTAAAWARSRRSQASATWPNVESTANGEATATPMRAPARSRTRRSEERRVGKECRSRWSPYH